jgi:hypothetical protein
MGMTIFNNPHSFFSTLKMSVRDDTGNFGEDDDLSSFSGLEEGSEQDYDPDYLILNGNRVSIRGQLGRWYTLRRMIDVGVFTIVLLLAANFFIFSDTAADGQSRNENAGSRTNSSLVSSAPSSLPSSSTSPPQAGANWKPLKCISAPVAVVPPCTGPEPQFFDPSAIKPQGATIVACRPAAPSGWIDPDGSAELRWRYPLSNFATESGMELCAGKSWWFSDGTWAYYARSRGCGADLAASTAMGGEELLLKRSPFNIGMPRAPKFPTSGHGKPSSKDISKRVCGPPSSTHFAWGALGAKADSVYLGTAVTVNPASHLTDILKALPEAVLGRIRGAGGRDIRESEMRVGLAFGAGQGMIIDKMTVLTTSYPKRWQKIKNHVDRSPPGASSGENAMVWGRGVINLSWMYFDATHVGPYFPPPIPPQSVDLVMCASCLVNTNGNTGTPHFMEVLRNVLRPGGFAWIVLNSWTTDKYKREADARGLVYINVSGAEAIIARPDAAAEQIATNTAKYRKRCPAGGDLYPAQSPDCVEMTAIERGADSPGFPASRWAPPRSGYESPSPNTAYLDTMAGARETWEARFRGLSSLMFGEKRALANILDVGCADGGAFAAGIDEWVSPSWTVLCVVPRNNSLPLARTSMLRGYASSYWVGFPKGALLHNPHVFDVVHVSAHFLSQIPTTQDAHAIAAEIARTARPKSKIAVEVPRAPSAVADAFFCTLSNANLGFAVQDSSKMPTYRIFERKN